MRKSPDNQGGGRLSVVTFPVSCRQNDDGKLTKHQRNMIAALKKAENRIRRGEVRSCVVVTRHTQKADGRYKGCVANYGIRGWDDMQVMASYLDSAAMKCPASAACDEE